MILEHRREADNWFGGCSERLEKTSLGLPELSVEAKKGQKLETLWCMSTLMKFL